ncbi:MAG: hypothetical protein LBD31_04440 [Treponema sp.]|jgi:hypothetical protein|nr:hypothetical protein [Treponema sp.]
MFVMYCKGYRNGTAPQDGAVHPGAHKNPDCLKCVHFKVSWDPAFPRACGLFGFKGRFMPSAEVFRATGRICPAFLLKKRLLDSPGI